MHVDLVEPHQVEHPKEPGVVFSVRPLSGLEAREARKAQREQVVENQRVWAGITLPTGDGDEKLTPEEKARQEEELEKELAKAKADPLTGFEPFTVARMGVVGWSGPGYAGRPCTPAEVDKLGEWTVKWAARQVLAISEIDRGEEIDSGPGTASSVNGASVRSSSPSKETQNSLTSGEPS